MLLAPVDRRRVLLTPALKQVRFAVFAGAVSGAIVGQLAARRLPDTLLPWAGSGALAGALIGLLYVGAGYVACGLRVPRWMATIIGAALLGWSLADLLGTGAVSLRRHRRAGRLAARAPRGGRWPPSRSSVGLVVIGLGLLGRVSLGGGRAADGAGRPAPLRR